METLMDNNSADTARLLEQARAGDQAALNEIFAMHRARLRRMVELRLFDPSTLLSGDQRCIRTNQEAYVDSKPSLLDEYPRRADDTSFSGCG